MPLSLSIMKSPRHERRKLCCWRYVQMTGKHGTTIWSPAFCKKRLNSPRSAPLIWTACRKPAKYCPHFILRSTCRAPRSQQILPLSRSFPVSLSSFAREVVRIPSITTWTRLEPRPREGSMQRSLQAQVRDPLWFLARQWQIGEFLGDDAGSPVQATLGLEQRSITTYRPGLDDGATVAIDPKLPIET